MSTPDSNGTTFKVPKRKHKATERKPTPYHTKTTKKVKNLTKTVLFSDEDCGDSATNHKLAKKQKLDTSNKKVLFSQVEGTSKGKIDRKATPYHLFKQPNNQSSINSLKTVLFPLTNSDSESEEELNQFEVTPINLASPTTSELVSSSKARKRNNSFEVSEVNCNDLDVIFNNSITIISDDDSDSSKSDEIDVSQTNCENSIVHDNISLIVNTSSEQDLTDFESEFVNEEDDFNGCASDEDEEVISIQDEEEDEFLNGNGACTTLESAHQDDINVDEVIEISENEADRTIKKCKTLKNYHNLPNASIEELNLETVTINGIKFTILPHNTKAYIHGLLTATVLHGSVELLGYKLTSSSGPKNVYSPKGSPFLYFETKKFIADKFDKTFIEFLEKLGMTEDPLAYLPIKTANCCILSLGKLEQVELNFMEKCIPYQLFPTAVNAEPRYNFLNKDNNWNFLNVNPEWETLTNLMTPSDRLLVVGGKGVGKSVMCRYVLNKLLMKHPKVLLIDLDPGQPECTVPGCVSISTIEEPLFGPNYTHLKKPLKCVFVPNINIFNSPHEYVSSVKELLDVNLPPIPTVINYMGYTRELGLELLSAVVAYSKPTLVTQIYSENDVQNFKIPLSYDLFVERAKFFAENEVVPKFIIKTIGSIADVTQSSLLLPREKREMCILTYLGTLVSPDNLSFIDSKKNVYIINVSSMKLFHNQDEVSVEVINGNLVALCSSNNICYGWGVVRGINSSKDDLYLQTPLSLEEFAKVDCLILGFVLLPTSLYLSPSIKVITNPYVCLSAQDLMGKIPKRIQLPAKLRSSKK